MKIWSLLTISWPLWIITNHQSLWAIVNHCIHIHTLYNHHPFKATFQGGTMPQCKILFLGPPRLNVKLVAERPPGVVFVRRVFKIPSKCKLTFWVRPPLKTVVIFYIYIYYRYKSCLTVSSPLVNHHCYSSLIISLQQHGRFPSFSQLCCDHSKSGRTPWKAQGGRGADSEEESSEHRGRQRSGDWRELQVYPHNPSSSSEEALGNCSWSGWAVPWRLWGAHCSGSHCSGARLGKR